LEARMYVGMVLVAECIEEEEEEEINYMKQSSNF